jgi:hypothetical protein
MVLTYFLHDFDMVPAVPVIIGITLVFTFHIRCISTIITIIIRHEHDAIYTIRTDSDQGLFNVSKQHFQHYAVLYLQLVLFPELFFSSRFFIDVNTSP